MAGSALAVQVLNLSPIVTRTELNTFFSYCGTVEKIAIQKNSDQSQSALVTFTQPYALQTALLLTGALLGGQPIRVLPVQDVDIPITGPDIGQSYGVQRFVPTIQAVMQVMALKGIEMWSMTKEIEENYKLVEKGRVLIDQARSTMCDAEQAAENYVSNGAVWLSTILDKTSQCVSNLGTRKRNGPNSGKQK